MKLDLNLFVDLTDSETLEEEMVRGTSARGGDKDGAGQRGCGSLKAKQGKVPISEQYNIIGHVYYAHQP